MEKRDYLQYLANQIKSVVVATVDSSGKPVTMVLDILDADDHGLYFLTFKGKGLYNRLSENPYVSITGMKGTTPRSMIAITVKGEAIEIGTGKISELLSKNEDVASMFPNGVVDNHVTVFLVHNGTGEWMDTSKGSFDRDFFEI